MSSGSINIMEICNGSAPTPVRKCRRRPAFMPAEDLCMHAENGKSAGGKSFYHRLEEVVE